MSKKIGNPELNNKKLKDIIEKIQMSQLFLNNDKDFREYILKLISTTSSILDIGKSMRDKYKFIECQDKKTLDINQFDDYPDFQMDLSDKDIKVEKTDFYQKFDVIICLAVLEHVYDPIEAVENIKKFLKRDGTIFGYVPFLYNYHAPDNLEFQDFYRYSKDGIAYLFRDFNSLTLYPVRGKISSSLHVMLGSWWKRYFEKLPINFLLNKLYSKPNNLKQCSGYYFIAK